MPSDAQLARLREIAGVNPAADLVVLFGSVARGTAAPWSDVDIGVRDLPFWAALELGSQLGAVLGREAHVVDLTTTSTWLQYLVAREGVLLFAREPATWPRFQADAAVRWFDIQPIVARCADGVRQALLSKEPRLG